MKKRKSEAHEEVESEETIQYPFYTEGSKELMDARIDIANFSILRAATRLQGARDDAEIEGTLSNAGGLALVCSEIGNDRPHSGCSFSNDGKLLATFALIWSMPRINIVSTLKGHTERATDISFSPVQNLVATASADRTAKLWNTTDCSVLHTFKGHLDRLARIAFHPSGNCFGTTSFESMENMGCRYWSGVALLLQKGHSIYGIAFHHDGSLVGTCGLDALARVWDLRTRTSILALKVMSNRFLASVFHPMGIIWPGRLINFRGSMQNIKIKY